MQLYPLLIYMLRIYIVLSRKATPQKKGGNNQMKAIIGAATILMKSLSRKPMLSFVMLIFIVMTYVQVEKLDKMNSILMDIHTDNALIREYVIQEKNSGIEYLKEAEEINSDIKNISKYILGGT